MWKYIFIIIGLLYVLSPFDILPDWIIGWGWLDDLAIVGLLARYFFGRSGKSAPLHQRAAEDGRSSENKSSGNRRSDAHRDDDWQPPKAWDPYQILSVARDASDLEIKLAYRRLANQYHPDKVTHLGKEFRELAEIKFKEIQRAYQELS